MTKAPRVLFDFLTEDAWRKGAAQKRTALVIAHFGSHRQRLIPRPKADIRSPDSTGERLAVLSELF